MSVTSTEVESWLIYQYIVSECSNCLFMTDTGFRARDIGLRAQKKILSRMAGKHVARALIDDVTASLLDNLYSLAKQYSRNKKEAEKLIKNIIKIVIKLGVLHRNNVFSAEELNYLEHVKTKLHMAVMAVISFHEVDFSYDRNYLISALNESHKCLQFIVSKHLTEKSLSRIDSVFHFFANDHFLDAVFKTCSEYKDTLSRIVADLNKAIDNGDL
ncbi:hypothetical protein FQA39_LY16688 [Lamprigera yunnana]|nr:hypothetical protein FQA39_LY16688 [Lamprigera yunnana]